MSSKAAINGLGRIGRAILKLLVDEPGLELVAVNDLVDAENLAYLLRFDTVYGRYPEPVAVEDGELSVAGRRLRTLRARDPAELPWRELGVDVVFECTGALKKREAPARIGRHHRRPARFRGRSQLTKVIDGDLLKIMSWYDNEWGTRIRWCARPSP